MNLPYLLFIAALIIGPSLAQPEKKMTESPRTLSYSVPNTHQSYITSATVLFSVYRESAGKKIFVTSLNIFSISDVMISVRHAPCFPSFVLVFQ